eukprot:274932_1
MKSALFIMLLLPHLIYSIANSCDEVVPTTPEDCHTARPLDGTCCVCGGGSNCEGCEEGSCSPSTSPTTYPTAFPSNIPSITPTEIPTSAPTLPKITCD